MSKEKITKKELLLLNELYFFHGIIFKALIPKPLPADKKDFRLKSCREINRDIKMRNRLMKQHQQQKTRTHQ